MDYTLLCTWNWRGFNQRARHHFSPSTRQVAKMDPSDFLSLAIEASVAIVGFSGIVVVLGPRQFGDWDTMDRMQLRALLIASITPFTISGLTLVLLTSDIPLESIWRSMSLVNLGVFGVALPSGVRLARSQSTEQLKIIQRVAVFSCVAAVCMLLVANVVYIAAFWPLALAIYFQICMALLSFVQLLWRSIFGAPG